MNSLLKLSARFDPYLLTIPSLEKIHHVLAQCTLLVSDAGTMISEAAVLGVHAVRVSPIQAGVFVEEEEKYHLVFSFTGKDRAAQGLQKAIELLHIPDLRWQGKKKAEVLIRDKIDINQYMLNLIEHTEKTSASEREAA